MKTIQGLLRYDRMNEDCWIFDMEYQTISVRTGMAMSIQIDNHFREGQLLEMLDGGLSLAFPRHQEYKLDPNERYPAKMAAKLVEDLVNEAALWDEQNATEGPNTDNETTDLPF